MTKHTAIAALSKGRFDAIEVETPTPGPGHVLLKVEYASMIAFDTYITDLGYAVADNWPITLGVNASGRIAEVGAGVSLAVGDRITAFSPHIFDRKNLQGTMQEYIVLPEHVCAKIPESLALDAAATLPDNFVTAFYTLFDQLALPVPTSFPAPSPPPNHAAPILIYGAGATAGQYALMLLRAAGYTNVTATASARHHALLRALGAAHTLDYASPTLAADAAAAAGGTFAYAVDSISADGTIAKVAPLVRPGSRVALLLPIKMGETVAVGDAGMRSELPADGNPFAEGVQISYVKTFTYRQNQYLKDNLMPKILPQLLESGIIEPNWVRLLDQGSFKERVAAGLDLLRNNKVSGEKIIVKVA